MDQIASLCWKITSLEESVNADLDLKEKMIAELDNPAYYGISPAARSAEIAVLEARVDSKLNMLESYEQRLDRAMASAYPIKLREEEYVQTL